MIQGKDTKLEEATYDEDFLLVRVVTTGWKYYEEGVRDVDELVAVAVEAIEDDVTDEDMLTDLIQMIQEVFDQVGSHCIASVSVLQLHCPCTLNHTNWDFAFTF